MSKTTWTTFVACLLSCAACFAADAPARPESLLSGVDSFTRVTPSAAMAKFGISQITGQPFTTAISVQTLGQPVNRWDVGLRAPVKEMIHKQDLFLVRFWARTVDALAPEGLLGVSVGLNFDPWEKLADGQYGAGREWTRIDLPFVAKHDCDAGKVQVTFRLGYPSQTVEIGGFELERYPAGTSLDSLPRTRLTYRGIEADAPWRKQAMERIEQIRKADVQVLVRDAQGQPRAGMLVHARLTRHDFRFGTAVDARTLLGESDASARYRETVAAHFNQIVFENDLKWDILDADPQRYGLVDRSLSWLNQNGIATRGHVLVWPAFRHLPKAAKALESDPSRLRQLVNDHITSMVERYRGRLSDWDVLNEPFSNRDLEHVLGRDAFVEWFKLAHVADPQAELFFNDYGMIESAHRLKDDRREYDYELVKYLIDHGAPIDGIGMQGHFGSQVIDPENMLKVLDQFGALGKRLRITELDMDIADPELEAQFFRDVLIVCFSHPAVDGVLQWGFWEGRHWLSEAALYDRNWNLRPHGQAWLSLMQQWTTDVTVRTGADGRATFRGFQGSYAVEVNGTSGRFTLPKDGCAIELTCK